MNFLTALRRGDKITQDKEKAQGIKPSPSASHGSPQPSKSASVDDEGTGFNPSTVGKYTGPLLPYSNRPVYQGSITPKAAEVYYPQNSGLSFKKSKSYGGVVVNESGQFLLREPSGHFDNYVWTWPKGSGHLDEHPIKTALREVFEETGYRCELIQPEIIGEFYNQVGSKSVFYLMRPIEQAELPDSETESIRWASYEEAKDLIQQTTNRLGRLRDLTVLEYAKEALAKFKS